MIPGAPPVMLLSVTLIRATPFCRNEIVEPTAVSCNCVPAASAPAVVRASELNPGPRAALVQPQLLAAVVPEVDPQVLVLAAVLHPHRRPDPLPAGQLRRCHLDLRRLITRVRLADCGCHLPSHSNRAPPATRSTIRHRSQPSNSLPSPPSARLKSSDDRPDRDVVEQATATVVTFADETVPEPFDTVQLCPDGFLFTVTP